MVTAKQAQEAMVRASSNAAQKINIFAREVLHTRGGRIGSGMGTLLEALWGYFTNHGLVREFSGKDQCELAWMYGHEYNDFALVLCCDEWKPECRGGELLRVEMKSMVASADESKAHFAQIERELTDFDLLVVLVWDWMKLDAGRICPQVLSQFIGPALPVARLRDALHEARGGKFVDPKKCPDGCKAGECTHGGEPLNENGKRERLTGPEACRVSAKVSYAANFGGMVRMLKTDSEAARAVFRKQRLKDDVAHAYISFSHKVFPKEELNQYTTAEWQKLAELLDVPKLEDNSKAAIAAYVRENYSAYQEHLRNLGRKLPGKAAARPVLPTVVQAAVPHAGSGSERQSAQMASPKALGAASGDDLQTLLRRIRGGSERP